MEMHEIQAEPESKAAEDGGASGPKPESKTSEEEGASGSKPEVKPEGEEEAEPDHYAKLENPSEDVYSETYYLPVKGPAGKQPEGGVRLYRAACLLLALLCFILLLTVIILSVKLPSTSCPEIVEAPDVRGRNFVPPPTCSLDQCQRDFPVSRPQRLGCQQCSKGWLTYDRSCFYLSTIRMNWTESQRNCSSRGGSLAVLSSPAVQTFLTEKGELKYWIGLRNKGSTWTWVNNTALQKSYWSDDPQDGDCGILSSKDPVEKNWIRAPCHASTYFICQLHL